MTAIMMKDTSTMCITTEPKLKPDGGVEVVKCECCGLPEECTPTYIATVRESHRGRLICGLCAAAVKNEMERCCSESMEEAMDRHMRFCNKFRSEMRNPAEELISAVKQLLIRSLDSPRSPGFKSVRLGNSGCRWSSSIV